MAKPMLIDAVLPEFGEPTLQPALSGAIYQARMAAALAAASAAGHDALVVYGDREHAANVSYLTGYDPRFEECLLVALPGRRPSLLLGNEGWGYAETAAGDFDRLLCQSFSLPGQPRGEQKPLAALLGDAGLTTGMRIGAVGWKIFDAGDLGSDDSWLDLPDFIASHLRAIGPTRNATGLFIEPASGLRAINECDQLASFEFAATYASQAIRNVIFGLRPGMTELEAARLMALPGLPLSCHPMLSTGPRAAFGLPSPSAKTIARGDPITMACGIQGGLTARAGFVVSDASELPVGIQDYVEKLAAPYFAAVVEWYETVGIGVTGGALYDIIARHLGDKFFGVGLNPGHLIHIDEWMHAPIYPGSNIALKSGMAIQVDVIPATHTPWFTTNIEDGIALADADLRAEFAARYPEAWARITARRAFMQDTLGITLRSEVLPFSNIPAYLPPFFLSPNKVLAMG